MTMHGSLMLSGTKGIPGWFYVQKDWKAFVLTVNILWEQALLSTKQETKHLCPQVFVTGKKVLQLFTEHSQSNLHKNL